MKRLLPWVSVIIAISLGSPSLWAECGGAGTNHGKKLGQANGCYNQCPPAPPGCTFFECVPCACDYLCATPGSSALVRTSVPISGSSLPDDVQAGVSDEAPFTPNVLDGAHSQAERPQNPN
jgi:hypothetical protein